MGEQPTSLGQGVGDELPQSTPNLVAKLAQGSDVEGWWHGARRVRDLAITGAVAEHQQSTLGVLETPNGCQERYCLLNAPLHVGCTERRGAQRGS